MAIPLSVTISFPVMVVVRAPSIVKVPEGHIVEDRLPYAISLVTTE